MSQERGLRVSLAGTQTPMTCPRHISLSLHRADWASWRRRDTCPCLGQVSFLLEGTRLRVPPGTPTDPRFTPKGRMPALPRLPSSHGTLLHLLQRRVNSEPPSFSLLLQLSISSLTHRNPFLLPGRIPSVKASGALVSSQVTKNCKALTLFVANSRDSVPSLSFSVASGLLSLLSSSINLPTPGVPSCPQGKQKLSADRLSQRPLFPRPVLGSGAQLTQVPELGRSERTVSPAPPAAQPVPHCSPPGPWAPEQRTDSRLHTQTQSGRTAQCDPAGPGPSP